MLEINLDEAQQAWLKNMIRAYRNEHEAREDAYVARCGHNRFRTKFTERDLPKIVGFDSNRTSFFEIKKEPGFVDRKDFKKVSRCDYDIPCSRWSSRWTTVELLPGTISDFEQKFPYSGVEQAREMFEGYWANYYLAQYMDEYLHSPQIELVIKVCPNIVESFLKNRDKIRISKFGKCFKDGRNMKEVTGMPDWLWKLLGENLRSIDSWDTFRIWYLQSVKEGKPLTKEFAEHFFDFIGDCPNKVIIDKFRKIIKNAKTNDGKQLFTIESLISYLERIDMYQAIPTYEGLDILTDYIRMCKDMGIEPLTNSNSLKREHDVTARTYCEWKNEHIHEEEVEGFKKRYKELSKYTYEDDNLVVVIPKEPMDMVNEGKNNRNCVGSYTNMHANGRATIFFIRMKSKPEKSYITIQLDRKCEEVRQAYYGCNRAIDKQSDLDFIQNWLKNNETINKGGAR